MNICLLDSGLGVIPFIKEILKAKKGNNYYIYIDNEYFPYGDKTNEELRIHLLDILYRLNDRIDELLICCNTLSYVYLNNSFQVKFKVKTILEINLCSDKDILCTRLLSENIKGINGDNLAFLIENNLIKEIVRKIKEIGRDSIIMGCTHYSLITSIFSFYFKNIESNEAKLISNIYSTNNECIFYAKRNIIHKINEFFPNLVIKEMDY